MINVPKYNTKDIRITSSRVRNTRSMVYTLNNKSSSIPLSSYKGKESKTNKKEGETKYE